MSNPQPRRDFHSEAPPEPAAETLRLQNMLLGLGTAFAMLGIGVFFANIDTWTKRSCTKPIRCIHTSGGGLQWFTEPARHRFWPCA